MYTYTSMHRTNALTNAYTRMLCVLSSIENTTVTDTKDSLVNFGWIGLDFLDFLQKVWLTHVRRRLGIGGQLGQQVGIGKGVSHASCDREKWQDAMKTRDYCGTGEFWNMWEGLPTPMNVCASTTHQSHCKGKDECIQNTLPSQQKYENTPTRHNSATYHPSELQHITHASPTHIPLTTPPKKTH